MQRLAVAALAAAGAWLGLWLSVEAIYVTPTRSAEYSTNVIAWTSMLLIYILSLAVTKAISSLWPIFRGVSFVGLSAGAAAGLFGGLLVAKSQNWSDGIPLWTIGIVGYMTLAWLGSLANRWRGRIA